jgi:ribosomal protein S12 methylthiotransferase
MAAPRSPARRTRRSAPAAAPKVGFVSLGCPKALVDSERILTQLRAEGYETVPSYDAADVVVVNTCGFIDAAVEESLDAIGEAMAENGKVIVTGCLGTGPKSHVVREKFPDLLSISGPQDYGSVMRAVHTAVPPAHDPFLDLLPPQGIKLTPKHYAYVKISEGCNHKCSFCIIPSMRGRLRSRPVGEVLREAEKLVKAGVQELLIISQDTSAYGADLKYAGDRWRDRDYETRLLGLCEGLGELGGDQALPLALGLGWKLVVAPLSVLALGALAGVGGLTLTIGVMQAAMAPMISAAILADQHGLDPPLANNVLGAGILLSMVSVPVWSALLG